MKASSGYPPWCVRIHGAIALATLALVGAACRSAEAQDPRSLRAEIDRHHPGVPWITTDRLAEWLSAPDGDRPVLLDARRQEEFGTSHLEGAIRVDPDRPDIASLPLPRDARVVVYCSVGYRSADVGRQIQAAGHRRVWNLLGGLFQWANEGRPLIRGAEPTRLVHPYDSEWGRYLRRRYRAPL